MKPQPHPDFLARGVAGIVPQWPQQDGVRWFLRDGMSELIKCPHGKPGDRLWARETTESYGIPNLLTGEPTDNAGGRYCADKEPVLTPDEFDVAWWYSRPTCPGIHMPRWASRITLEITDVRVERLREISEDDALSEGVAAEPDWTAAMRFAQLWDHINGKRAPWASNPFVWVICFRQMEKSA